MKINQETLHEIFNSHGFIVDTIIKVKTGKFNQTYIGEVAEHNTDINLNENRIVLRIAPPADAGFVFYEKEMMKREPEIHRIVKENTNIPVPEIHVFAQQQDLIDRKFLLMEFITGTPLSEITLNPVDKKKVMKNAGNYLKSLHNNCRHDSFGYPENEYINQEDDWLSAFKNMWNNLINDLVECNVYDKEESCKAREAFTIHQDLFRRDISPSLLHMDIWSQNILVNNTGDITGILDWDRALWGDPEIEFAVLDYCGFNNKDFWEGYGGQPEETPATRIRSKFYHLYEVQKYPVIWTKRGPNSNRVEQYKSYSLNIINNLLK